MLRRRSSGLAAVFLTFAAAGVHAETCTPTLPSGKVLSLPGAESWYGTEALAVQLKPEGRWIGSGPERNHSDKLFWASSGFRAGDERHLRVTARRLDGREDKALISDPTHAFVKKSGLRAMLIGVAFPSTGCWEIQGEYLGQRLSFVVDVGAPASAAVRQSPVAARPRLAMAVVDVPPALEIGTVGGARVVHVQESGLGHQSGFRVDDVIVQYDDVEIRSADQLSKLVASAQAGTVVMASAYRKGALVSVALRYPPQP